MTEEQTYVTIDKNNLIALANSLRATTGSSNLFSGESLVYEVTNFLNENKIFYETYTASTTGTVTIEHNLGALPDVIGVLCLSTISAASSSRPSGTSGSSYTNYADNQLLSAKAEKDLEGNYSTSTLYAHPQYYYNSSRGYSYYDDNIIYVSPSSTSTLSRISNITETSFSVPFLDSGKQYAIFAFIHSN